jgi:uncharacterized protein
MTNQSHPISMFPLSGVFIPGDTVSLRIFESRYVAMCHDLLAGDDLLFSTVMITAGSEVGGNDRRANVGTVVHVSDMFATSEGGYSIIGIAKNRCQVEEWLPDDPYPKALISDIGSCAVSTSEVPKVCRQISTMSQRIRSVWQQIADHRGEHITSMPVLTQLAAGQWWSDEMTDDAIELAFWNLVRHLPCGPQDRYSLLVTMNYDDRFRALQRILDDLVEVIAFQLLGNPDEES